MENKIQELTDKIYREGVEKGNEEAQKLIQKAQEEAGFEPHEGDWISVEITTWKIMIHVYPKSGCKGARYWINGKWFDTAFPSTIPSITEIEL